MIYYDASDIIVFQCIFRIGIENPGRQYGGSRFHRGRITAKRTDISGFTVSVLQGAGSEFTSNPEAAKITQYQIEKRQGRSETPKLPGDRGGRGCNKRVQKHAKC